MLGDNWELTVTNDQILYNKEAGCDCLLVYVTAENKGKDARIYNDLANVFSYQGDESLDIFQEIKDKDGNKVPDLKSGAKSTDSGKSIDLVYGWKLKNDNDVKVSFAGFTVAVKGKDIVFSVKDRITDEWKDSMKSDKESKDSKKNTKNVDAKYFSLTPADGWYVDNSDETSADLINEATKNKLEIKSSSSRGTAQEWADKMAGNYQKEGTTDTVKIGDTDYIRLQISDTQYMLFSTCSDGKNVVNIYSMFMSQDETNSQLKLIKIK